MDTSAFTISAREKEESYLNEACRLIDLVNELMVAKGEGIVREFGIHMYTLLYLKGITKKDLLYNTWNSAQCYVAAWMGGESGGEQMHVCVWLSPSAVHLKLSGYG